MAGKMGGNKAGRTAGGKAAADGTTPMTPTSKWRDVPSGFDPQQTRDHRGILRFMYQVSAKGRGKTFQEWTRQWREARRMSERTMANAKEGHWQTSVWSTAEAVEPLGTSFGFGWTTLMGSFPMTLEFCESLLDIRPFPGP